MNPQELEACFARIDELEPPRQRALIEALLDALERGDVRAANPSPQGWRTNTWVKRAILAAFRLSQTRPAGEVSFAAFYDREAFPPRHLSAADGVRIVPGGSAVRRGACLSRGVIVMPPAYVNVGAFVGEDTMIDSHVLVGSCAQVGARVHLSAGCQLGGVLEPAGARPVIVEDEVLVGGNCGVYEGILVRRRAVLAAGVVLTASTPVFDVVHGRVMRSTAEAPLEIPEGAVVVPGSRAMEGGFARSFGLGLACAVIVKYRDAATEARVALEQALRGG